MKAITLILPHQLFEAHPGLEHSAEVFIVEDPLFFADERYPVCFHKQKLVFHRASMKAYADMLVRKGYQVQYLDAGTFKYEELFQKLGITHIRLVDPVDDIALKRIRRAAKNSVLEIFESPGFLTSTKWLEEYFQERTHYSFTPFYIEQRKRLNLLLENGKKPLGGRWTYDKENRSKAPKGLKIPPLPSSNENLAVGEAKEYVQKRFSQNLGDVDTFIYPITHEQALKWFRSFLQERLELFGTYQDAIVEQELVLMHGVLSPMLNSGLLVPSQVVTETLAFAKEVPVSINSLEGFLRQVVGWREFVRAIYKLDHVKQRTMNFWGHRRKIPASFYSGTTGCLPIDKTIQKLKQHAYCHHIERLMVLGNFMLLCEFDPDEVYRWFMEFFIDSYDWVMVPNVYGMSQYADGGLMTTKPYISSSAYIRKMSDYPGGEWCDLWDGLFWRFMKKNASFMASVPRLSLLLNHLPNVETSKLDLADAFLENLK